MRLHIGALLGMGRWWRLLKDGVSDRLKAKGDLTLRDGIQMQVISAFFAIMPPRVFAAISSDVIQIAVIIVPFVIAFMTILLSIDITFGLPVPSPETVEKISARREEFRMQLMKLLSFSLALILTALLAKSLVLWFLHRGWLAAIVMRFAAWTVGGMIAVLLIRIGDIRDIFGYLSVGADLAFRTRVQRSG